MELAGTSLAPSLPSRILHFHLFFLIFATILCFQPAHCLSKLGNETDKLALLQFKAKISNDPNGILSSWNDSVSFCKWQGVTCGSKHQRVTSLNLQGLSLSGTISPHAGNLTFLRFLSLGDNRFHGEIPQEVGYLFRLRHFNLSNNQLGGEIPGNISSCSELRLLDLINNNLVGKVPAELGSLKKLVILFIGENSLTGKIPNSLGNLSSLQMIYLAENHLQGKIPNEFGQLTSLTLLELGVNNLSGIIPPPLYNISSITSIGTTFNQLSGSLPANIGLTLPNLEQLFLAQNEYFGSIPESLANASRLRLIDISNNSFTGQFPTDLGYLKGLESLHLEFNFFGSNTSQDLSFLPSLANCSNLQQLYFDGNNFGGALPSSIGNLSNLVQLGFGRNPISGTIPEEVGSLVNLYRLDMDRNLFSGSIPISFGKLQKLERLTLNQNLLSGEIPAFLGIAELQLPACPIKEEKDRGPSIVIVLTTTISSFLFVVIAAFLCLFYWQKSKNSPTSSTFTVDELSRRLYIAIDVASALHYLHDHCETPIVHCDLKPSNILLDSDMTAHVGDFGLAKLLAESANSPSQSQTLSTGIKGTIGYMAPEYGVGSSVTTYGDVYSFGILLLEMFTGKRPTHDVFTDGLDLHNFVKAKLPRQVMQVVDPTLLTPGEVGAATAAAAENMDNDGSIDDSVREYVVSVLQIGLKCSTEVPKDRMSMKDATSKLNDIKDTFLHRHQKIVQNGSTMQQPQQQ
ncbi:putative receptor-like protein kinase At3g47110 [Manihot esculenta]|uniref:putative receptor-like protein kinase At3g47110 n=1 Tax=Manihot esculenta TaxID=3983 RepID=UPI001CC398D7|nr:putative receptor-like protein kinase At3g47110 [Manihot esculenta]